MLGGKPEMIQHKVPVKQGSHKEESRAVDSLKESISDNFDCERSRGLWKSQKESGDIDSKQTGRLQNMVLQM